MSNSVASLVSCEFDPQMSLSLFVHNVDDNRQEAAKMNLCDELSLDQYTCASFMRDDSLAVLGINESDLLLVDKHIKPQHDDLVLYLLDGELSCAKLDMKLGALLSGGEAEPINLKDHVSLSIEGVVRHIIRSLR